jgi:hypothetical protein
MSSTSNLQSLLAYVFRPAYTWTGSNFTTTINLSNIDKFTANTVTYQVLYIGDAFSNVYIGSNAGNAPGNVSNCNAYSNTAIGVQAGNGVSNSSNSVFIGFQSGLSAMSNNSSISIGLYSGYQPSNISDMVILGTSAGYSLESSSNSILIGTSNSSNLSNIFNTISIGASAGGIGNSNIYIGKSTGVGITGSCNLFLGNGLNATSGVSAAIENTLLIGRGSNVIASGNFSYGVLTIGTSNPSTVPVSTINAFDWGGNCNSSGYGFLALDVAGWTRMSSGLTIGENPYNPTAENSGEKFELDVSGHMRVTDGHSLMKLSNYYNNPTVGATGLSNNTVLSIAPVGALDTVTVDVAGTLTLSSNLTLTSGSVAVNSGSLAVSGGAVVTGLTRSVGGYSSFQGSFVQTSSTGGTTTFSNILKPGLAHCTVVDVINGVYFYTATFVYINAGVGVPTTPITSNSTANNIFTITSSGTSIVITTVGSPTTRTLNYNFTLFPVV